MSKKKKHDEAHENHERWLITYADLITLLMVFFVVMFSMARADQGKFSKLSASLQQAFRVDVLRGNNPTQVGGDDGATMISTVLQTNLSPPSFATQSDAKLVSTVSDLNDAMQRIPPSSTLERNIEVGAGRDGVVISMSGNALFDSGRADLKSDGVVLLDTLAPRLRDMPNEIRIEGHTDSVAISTPLFPSNWELSSARATTVARRLIEFGGIKANRVIAAGYGDSRPAATNESREGRARNRRVDVVILSAPAQTQATLQVTGSGPAPVSPPLSPSTAPSRSEGP
ncbi:MAG: flagellar motor protein MotB [Chloroflexota bacterium]